MGPEKLISGSTPYIVWGYHVLTSFNGAGEINLRKFAYTPRVAGDVLASMGPEKLISGSLQPIALPLGYLRCFNGAGEINLRKSEDSTIHIIRPLY